MHTTRSRRWFLTSTATVAAAVPFGQLFASRVWAREYGELVPDPAGILDLPPGFSYTIVERTGDPMDDGFEVPAAPDGMACFTSGTGELVLMRNHEISNSSGNEPDERYDALAGGGVTRVVVDPRTGARISSNWVLAGTRRNCAGGPSPWGWLTCEENTDDGHGYVFVTDPNADSARPPQRIVGYGRFNHEAAAIDPRTSICYLTEDQADGCLYRFVPADPRDPFTGTLQALRVVGRDTYELGTMVTGDSVDIAWLDVPDPDPDDDVIRQDVRAAGAAVFVRGEGIWFHDGIVYVASTSGGPEGLGQIFRLFDDAEAPTLECLVHALSADQLNAPDNLTVSPWGQLFIAEDAYGTCFVRALTDAGEVVSFARNARSTSEFAGVCFSPDGRIMFVNAQSDGTTFAITGPFPEVPEGTGDTDSDTDSDSDSTNSGGEDGADATGSADSGSSPDDDSDSSEGSAGATEGEDEGCGCSTSPGRITGLAALLGFLARRRST